jgi:hypothetical protein
MKKPRFFKQHKDIPNFKPKEKKSHKWLIAKIAIFIIIITCATYGILKFIDEHEFRSPIIFQNPIPVKERYILSPVGTASAQIKVVKTREEMTNEEYIRFVFNKEPNTAVAIAKAESGLDEVKVGKNNNGSFDFGCWQINSIHLNRAKTAVERGEMINIFMNCKDATDWAYNNLYKYQGFSPWVAFTSGSYLNKL